MKIEINLKASGETKDVLTKLKNAITLIEGTERAKQKLERNTPIYASGTYPNGDFVNLKTLTN
jgi:hypothetical protein